MKQGLLQLPVAVRKTLIEGFYRRNVLFFTLLLIFAAFVCRPATLLVSPPFVLPMLEDLRFFGGVLTLLALYQMKTWRDNLRALDLRDHEFLYMLGALHRARLLGWLAIVSISTMAPALMYSAVIAAYSVWKGTWHVGILSLVQGGICLGASLQMRQRILGGQVGGHTRMRRLKPWHVGLTYALWQAVWQTQRQSLLVHKVMIAALWVGVAGYHQQEPFSEKGMGLVMLSLTMLQAMLPYQLRRNSDTWLMSWRNLPLPTWRWWLGYVLLAGGLFLPEAWVMLAGGLPFGVLMSYWLGAIALFVLAIGILYHQAFAVETYLIRVGQVYIVAFLAILYQVPWWGMGLGMFAFGYWIFQEEFRQWNGFL